jgi:hypothetical protein
LSSCAKWFTGTGRTFRYKGYIFNAFDSLPFKNTKFQVYNDGRSLIMEDDSIHLFTTDSNGYFDVTTFFLGNIYWPSFFVGAAYSGPGSIENNGFVIDSINNQWILDYYFYTTPYK